MSRPRRVLNAAITPVVMAGIKAWFVVGERAYPRRAAARAVKMWMRVPPPPPPARRDRGVSAGESLDIEVAGRPINALGWGAGPVILCAHGWGAWWQQYSVYIEPLTAAGFRVVAWDAPSHGDSAPGEFGPGRSGMPDLAAAIEAVADAVGPVHGLIAHSGATLAAMQTMRRGVRPGRVAFISTSVAASDQLAYFSRQLGWGPKIIGHAVDAIEQGFDVTMADWELIDGLPTELPPLLMLHHEVDGQTPLAGARRLAERWPDARLRITADHDHHRILWANWTLSQIVDFMSATHE